MVMLAESHPGNLNGSPLRFLQLPRMTVTEDIVKRKMTIKVGSRGVRVESEKESCEYGTNVLMNDECEIKKSSMKIERKLPVPGQPNKRRPDAMVDAQKEKRRKMDRSVKQQCGSILKELMTHRHGWAFNQPVDPIAYNIPDYLSIISKPMDLGTIKSKMENNVYFGADEFAADVRLTFSNCMLYNPPHNEFHGMAKELNNIFSRRWKLLGAKLNHESEHVGGKCISNGQEPQGILTDSKISPSNDSSTNRREMSLEEKHNLRRELREMLRGKMTEKLQIILRKFNLCSLKERIDADISAIDDETLWELKGAIQRSLKLTTEKVEPAKMTQSGGRPLSRNVVDKGMDTGSRISCGSANGKPSIRSVDSKCGSCGSLACRCSLQNRKTHASSCYLSSGKSIRPDICGVSKPDFDAKNSTWSHINRSDFNGAGSLIEENVCLSPSFSVCGSTAVSDEGWTPPVDIELSPKKALRAAMLKSRFADTICKARQKSLHDHGEKVDLVKLQQEKERLEKQQRKEKARIEAQIAAEAASRLRAEAELRMQRQREREAARIALQQMEKTVEIDENLKFLKDLEKLSQSLMSDYPLGDELGAALGTAEGGHVRNPLERLGLYIKDDFMEDDEEEAILNGDREEGEIIR